MLAFAAVVIVGAVVAVLYCAEAWNDGRSPDLAVCAKLFLAGAGAAWFAGFLQAGGVFEGAGAVAAAAMGTAGKEEVFTGLPTF
jgi:hypothetical protein